MKKDKLRKKLPLRLFLKKRTKKGKKKRGNTLKELQKGIGKTQMINI
jgi:hypothetical protein